MKDSNAERMLRKYKGFANSVKQMLNQEYKFLGGDKSRICSSKTCWKSSTGI